MSKYTKELLEPLVKQSISMRGVLRKLGLKTSGGNNSFIKKKIINYEISINHFLGQGHMKGKVPKNKRTKVEFIKDILKKEGKVGQSHKIKLKLYKFNLKEEKCEICNLENQWNGELISLHLDHINGINNDNRIENLRILCPNCHSQTKTYAGKKLRKHTKVKIKKATKVKIKKFTPVKIKKCLECNKLINIKSTRCKSCQITKRNAEKRDFILPTKEELYKFLKDSNFLRVGKKYGVSDNAVRKWCKKYELPTNSSYFK